MVSGYASLSAMQTILSKYPFSRIVFFLFIGNYALVISEICQSILRADFSQEVNSSPCFNMSTFIVAISSQRF